MLSIAPVFLLTISYVLITILNLSKVRPGYPWLIALVGSAFAVVYFLVARWVTFPALNILAWNAIPEIQSFIGYQIDATSWPLGFSLSVVLLSALLVAPAWIGGSEIQFNPGNVVLLMAFSILAVMASTPLAFVIAITTLDLLVTVILLTENEADDARSRVLISLIVRLLPNALILVATASTVPGQPFILGSANDKAVGLIFFAAVLRGLLIPAILRFELLWVKRPILAIVILLGNQVAGLSLLLRLSSPATREFWGVNLTPLLITLLVLSSIYWLLERKPAVKLRLWIYFHSLLILLAFLFGAQQSALIFLLLMLIAGASFSLYVNRAAGLLVFPLIIAYAVSGLPFSLSALAWQGLLQSPFPLALALIVPMLFLPEFVINLLRDRPLLTESERWVRTMYYLGHAFLAATTIGMLFLNTFTFSLFSLAWITLPALLVLAVLLIVMLVRPGLLTPRPQPQLSWITTRLERFLAFIHPDAIASALLRLGSVVYGMISRVMTSFQSNLEGNAGFVWSLVFMLLIMSIVRSLVARP